MKTNSFIVSALLFSYSLTSVAQTTKKQEDIAAIKSMCGCYEVTFNFAETFQIAKDSTYKASADKKDYALEWVELVEEKPNKLILQHLLIARDTLIIKHWRQDWLYENTELYVYNKDNNWTYKKLNKKDVKGQWTQKVFQVDDSPRYEGSATWVHFDDKHYWMNTTDAPLPRREFSSRKDYNVLKRRNIHEITPYGWLHEQDNVKIYRDAANVDTQLAQEKGLDLYTKVADSKCKSAQKWWTENELIWKNVREQWQSIFDRDQNLVLEKSVDNKPLFMHLFDLKPNTSKNETDLIIQRFIKK